MKYFFIILFTALIAAGCGEKKEETPPVTEENKYNYDTTNLETTVLEDIDASFQFRYKFDKGSKYRYRVTTISEDDQTIIMDTTITQTVKQSVIYLFEFEPVNIDQDGIIELNVNINSVKLDAASGDQQVSFESGQTRDSAETVKYAEFESMINNPFSVRVTPNGEILELIRVDKILNRFLTIRGYIDSVTAEEKDMVKQDLINGVLKPLTLQIFRELPSTPVAKDTSWRVAQKPTRFMVFEVTNTNLYKVDNLEMLNGDTLIRLDAGIDTRISGDTKAVDRGVTYQFTKPVTTAEGTIYFNLTDGLIQKSKTYTTIDISYTMEASTPQGLQKGSRKEVIKNTNLVERL